MEASLLTPDQRGIYIWNPIQGPKPNRDRREHTP